MENNLPTSLIQFFIYFIKPYKRYMIGLFITGLVWGIQLSLAPYLLKLIINAIATDNGNQQFLQAIKTPAIAYVLLFLASATNFRIADWLKLTMFPDIRKGITVSMFAYLKQHSHSYFQNHFSGSLSNKISDMVRGSIFIFSQIDEAFAQIAGIIIATATMFLVHPLFALILFGWISIFLLVSVYFSKNAHHLSAHYSQSVTTLLGKIVDSVSNVMNTRLFARHHYEVTNIKAAVNETVNNDRSMQRYILKMRIFQDISIVILIACMMAGLIYMYTQGKVSVGDFVLILTISISIFQAIWFLSNQFVQFSEELGRCSQALTIITEPHAIVDVANAKELVVKSGKIEFQDVTFRYDNHNKIFENTNITIEPQQKVGLVGFSGSGKSLSYPLIFK